MKARHLKFFSILLAALTLIGCDSGRQAPAKTRVHVVNAAPSFAQLSYRREQTDSRDALAFKAVAAHDYDADTYDFNVYELQEATQTVLTKWTWAKELVADKQYTFVLAEAAGQVSPQIVEYPAKFANSTDTQMAVVHAGETLPAMDVYVQPTGAGIAGATPRGTVSFLGQVAPKTFASGDYEITLTAAGDPNNVLFASSAVNLAAGITNVFVIADEHGQGTATMSIVAAQDSSFVLYSTNATSGLRTINFANDGGARDFAINHEYAPPLFPGVPYGTVTNYATVPVNASLPITVTPVGNPGVIELDSQLSAAAGALNTVMFAGPAGTLVPQIVSDDRRRITNEAKLRFFNAANQFTTVTEMVLVPPTVTDQTTVAPATALVAPAVTDYLYATPGEYNLVLRETGTNTVRAGPIHVNLVSGGIYGIMALNGPDTATASVVFIDDAP
jgi:hypothetical protein